MGQKRNIQISMMKRRGQATIEFLLTAIFAFGILFLFVKMGLNFVKGYVAHYATFIASRAFLVGDDYLPSANFAEKRALEKGVDKFESFPLADWRLNSCPSGENGLSFNFPPGEGGHSAGDVSGHEVTYTPYIGASYTFCEYTSAYAIVGGGHVARFTSESFLGRTIPRGETFASICERFQKLADGSGISFSDQCVMSVSGSYSFVTIYDNGG